MNECSPHKEDIILGPKAKSLRESSPLKKLKKKWNQAGHKASILAVVGNANAGAGAQLIHQLPNLEIVSSFSVGLDKIDLAKCRERGIRVTNTPDVLTDDVADLAIGLMLAVLRRLCPSDRYVRSGQWKRGDYKLTTKVCFFFFFSSYYYSALVFRFDFLSFLLFLFCFVSDECFWDVLIIWKLKRV